MSDILGLSSNPAFDPTRLRGDEYAELAQASRNRMLANALVVADGTSCRHQIADGTHRQAVHVAQVLERALA